MEWGSRSERGVSPVISVVLLVAVTVVLAASAGGVLLSSGDSLNEPPPQVSIEHERYEQTDGDDGVKLVFHTGGPIEADRLVVRSTKAVDIGGSPDGPQAQWGTKSEAFDESSGGNPAQVGVGETWEAGEPAYLSGDGSLDGATFRVVWSSQPVEGINPGAVDGKSAHVLVDFTL